MDWTPESQASLSFTISWNLLKLISIESVMPSNHLILCHPHLLLPSVFPSIVSFLMSGLFASSGQSIGAPVSASVLPINFQSWFPFWLTGLISLLSKWLSRVFSSTTIWKHQFFGTWETYPVRILLVGSHLEMLTHSMPLLTYPLILQKH